MRERARRLKQEVFALVLAWQHPRTPLIAKILVFLIVAYALSPIDLIPDFIPILGYLDDLILVPAGIALALRLIPAEVMAECRARATREKPHGLQWLGLGMILLIWMVALSIVVYAIT